MSARHYFRDFSYCDSGMKSNTEPVIRLNVEVRYDMLQMQDKKKELLEKIMA